MTPFFSIIIPSYNRADLINNVIDSFLNQQYSNFEIIVVDDGGTDNTGEIVKGIADSRVQYVYKVNEERAAARNYGARLAKGEYVNFFDSDDIAYPNHLESAFQLIKEKKNPEVFHLGYEIISTEKKILATFNSFDGNVEEYCIKSKKVSINAIFLRKDITDIVPFSEVRALSASEDALWLCQLVSRYTVYYNNVITNAIIDHDLRSMSVASEKQLSERKHLLLEGLTNDPFFVEKYGHLLRFIDSEMSYLLCLSSLSNKNKMRALHYFKESVKKNPRTFFTKRTFFVAKCMITGFSSVRK
jgi:glycosyltransferase involved in cell wall biosynthesis